MKFVVFEEQQRVGVSFDAGGNRTDFYSAGVSFDAGGNRTDVCGAGEEGDVRVARPVNFGDRRPTQLGCSI